MSNTQGLIISFEGGEGGGKTTQIANLAKKIAATGKEVISVREPGGTDVSEQIRVVVLSTKNKFVVPQAEVLLFQAARAQVYGELVLPNLQQGKIVLMDRTRDSSVVYQGIVRNMGVEMIEQLNNISTQNTFPNLTLLLDVSVDTGLTRRAQTGEVNRLDAESREFHQKVRDTYLHLAKQDTTGRWVIIDAEKNMDEVATAIWQVVEGKLG